MSARTSGVSMAGLRMSPSSPPGAAHQDGVHPFGVVARHRRRRPWRTRRRGGRVRTAGKVHRQAPTTTLLARSAGPDRPGTPAVAPFGPAGPYARCHGRHVQADRRDLPGQGQQGPGQGGRSPRHAGSLLREAAPAAAEGPAGRGRRGHGPQAARAAGAGVAEAGRQIAGAGQGGTAAGQRGPGPRGALAARRAGRAAGRPQDAARPDQRAGAEADRHLPACSRPGSSSSAPRRRRSRPATRRPRPRPRSARPCRGSRTPWATRGRPCSGPRTRSPACRRAPAPWTSCWPRVPSTISARRSTTSKRSSTR